MTGREHVTARAWQDVVEIYTRIARDNPGVAERFVAAFESQTKFLARNPGAGGMIEPEPARYPRARSWPLTGYRNYLLIFRPVDAGVEVVRVMHGARDIHAALAE